MGLDQRQPGTLAQKPRAKVPEPDPPTPAEAARLLDAAFAMDEDWGTLVWLVMTTGMRRGEVCALRWRDVDFDAETLAIRRNYVLHKGVGREKDTKTHQMRRIALDSETVALLRDQRERLRQQIEELGGELTGETYVFGGTQSSDHRVPYSRTPCRAGTPRWPSDSGSQPTSTPCATTRRPSS